MHDDAIDQLFQEARRLRLIQFRLVQLQHTYDQLGAGIEDLAGRTREIIAASDAGETQRWIEVT